jgi:protein-S-isoprenylcysteine O-methyltransferase Ste14
MAFFLRPPLVALLLLVIAFVVDRLAPSTPWIPERLRWLGLVPIAAGVSLALWALRLFHRRRTTHDPFGTPQALVVNGPYRFTRNPMYLALTVLLVGIAWCLRTAPWWGVPAAFFLYVRLVNVPREERLLESLFGDSYRDYRAKVRRWL